MLNYRSQKGRHHGNTKHGELVRLREGDFQGVRDEAQLFKCVHAYERASQCPKQKQSSQEEYGRRELLSSDLTERGAGIRKVLTGPCGHRV